MLFFIFIKASPTHISNITENYHLFQEKKRQVEPEKDKYAQRSCGTHKEDPPLSLRKACVLAEMAVSCTTSG